MAFAPFNVNGQLELCGVWAHVGELGRDHAFQAIRGYSLVVNGKRVLNGVTFFTKAASPDDFPGMQATCAATGTPALGPNDRYELVKTGRSRFTSR